MADSWRPRTFTSAEAMLEQVRVIVHKDGRPQKAIAREVGVSPSTINNLASGKTRWPRPTTLFPLLRAMNMEIQLVPRKNRDA